MSADAQAGRKMQLGLFMPNCSNAYSMTTYKPVPDDWTYESNLKIARAAEDAGFDFLFPVAKWKGYGGKTDYLGTSLETFTWASALLANTSRINIYSTVHVPVFHPVATAKMGATLDHISKGRWGLNIVSGWSELEFGMMGIEVMPHAERYRRTEAYVDILKGLWTQEPGTFNYECPWYKITGGYVRPQPVRKPHPVIANAGGSDEAKALVARVCDWAFISPPTAQAAPAVVADIKQRAAARGRNVQCACYPFVLWRDTAAEAEEERRRILDNVDMVAVDNWARGVNLQSGSFDNFTLEAFTLGAGALPVIGTREYVAETLKQMYDGGMDGFLMVMLDYYQDTLRFQREILPLLRKMGVRP
jgi:alkanesulfonate monooxygenase SsuD/methylene tetrahydromethanopterin reductase-like flavin-dependent oxidoreductase (luciferase family)